MPSILEEPPEVKLVHDFVNTLDLRTFRYRGHSRGGGDVLSEPAGFEAWLGERGLGQSRVVEADLVLARATRASLRASITGEGTDPGTSRLVGVRLAAGEPPRLVPVEAGIAGALGKIVVASAVVAQQGLWPRLKQCPAEDCGWIFYDRTKPGRGRWCDPALCGNRMKTRAYRARRATTG
ncbi:CGNR zinc finger domain-containing protein [Amycolatopsis sp. PS_44_ISF1]|uniref:CGNR zinc finger domain-containing protein n=1 Tax=Amycolatopsis sp. PS_44_ISF1 TaxID=2974917 RepID=UPI0028E0838A|nr:CGNR zinc finger domain-containing protein [Amycolatopsis sp. PS_44_ISF1]MDT8912350.1 CGNR zinc finger domain-containing protein [Amycolatopsis sp. PS_44_ISF1]